MQVEIVDADVMQIGRHLIGRRDGGSEKINAFHGFLRDVFLRRPMNEFTSPNTFPALPQFVALSQKRLECRTSTVALEDVDQCRRREESQRSKSAFPLS
jgi:hypothetical protein